MSYTADSLYHDKSVRQRRVITMFFAQRNERIRCLPARPMSGRLVRQLPATPLKVRGYVVANKVKQSRNFLHPEI